MVGFPVASLWIWVPFVAKHLEVLVSRVVLAQVYFVPGRRDERREEDLRLHLVWGVIDHRLVEGAVHVRHHGVWMAVRIRRQGEVVPRNRCHHRLGVIGNEVNALDRHHPFVRDEARRLVEVNVSEHRLAEEDHGTVGFVRYVGDHLCRQEDAEPWVAREVQCCHSGQMVLAPPIGVAIAGIARHSAPHLERARGNLV